MAALSSVRPSSPPVTPPGLRRTMIDAAWAKASVTMAKAIPPTRRAIPPTTSARPVVMARATTMASQSGSDQVDNEIVSR